MLMYRTTIYVNEKEWISVKGFSLEESEKYAKACVWNSGLQKQKIKFVTEPYWADLPKTKFEAIVSYMN